MLHKDELQTIKASQFVSLPARLCPGRHTLPVKYWTSELDSIFHKARKKGNNESLHADGSSGPAGVMEHGELAWRETPAKDGWTTEVLPVISSPSFSAVGHSARGTSGS